MCARVKLIEAWLKCLHQTLWLLQPGLSWLVENPWVSVKLPQIDIFKGKLSQNWILGPPCQELNPGSPTPNAWIPTYQNSFKLKTERTKFNMHWPLHSKLSRTPLGVTKCVPCGPNGHNLLTLLEGGPKIQFWDNFPLKMSIWGNFNWHPRIFNEPGKTMLQKSQCLMRDISTMPQLIWPWHTFNQANCWPFNEVGPIASCSSVGRAQGS